MNNRDFQPLGRPEMVLALRALFPHLPPADTALAPVPGGRQAAQQTLARVDPPAYERSRNFLSGAVTRLSAYLRHGVLTLAEARDAALDQARDPREAGKLINEFAWRDYWQRLYFQLGEGIWQDREAYKTGYAARDYDQELPPDIPSGTTTLVCIDSFAHQLAETGYLHNHARMWTAAYVVHWRRVAWQAGARWFLEHLIDGDPASNNLSWQWVASTFASKAYFFNRENLERYTAGTYCRSCPHAKARTCPFEDSYEGLAQTLFPRLDDHTALPPPPKPFVPASVGEASASSVPAQGTPLLWIHTDSLNPASPMLAAHPGSAAVFIWDLEWLTGSRISLKRIVFLAECLRDMPGTLDLRVGDPASELLAAARAAKADYILVQRTPDPRLRAAANAVRGQFPLVWYDPPAFAEAPQPFDLKRFSRYWQRAQTTAMQPSRSRA